MIIKQTPKDFIVEEIPNLPEENLSGNYLYIKLKKTNYNTLDAIKTIINTLKIPRKNVGFAGTKDRNAITTQYISIKNIRTEQITKLNLKDIELTPIHRGTQPLSLGDLKGNKFTIDIHIKPKKVNFVINYFGPQRFGNTKENHIVGKLIITKQYKQAVEKLNLPTQDPIKSLKSLDKKLLSLYLNSFQSYLWNKAVEIYIEDKPTLKSKDYIFLQDQIPNIKFPLIAFDTEFKNKKIKDIYTKLLKEENLTQRDFLTRTFPEVLPLTQERDLIIQIKDFTINNTTVSFTLQKGAYATVVLSKMNLLSLNE